jgi:2-(1,2-epoxy-1,2-dihydrophenyl)acetyl-CoA isomerase
VTWLRTETADGIRWLTIDRPDRKNAIPADGWPLLTEAFIDFEMSHDRVLVVTGAGGEFCAGADLDTDRFSDRSAVSDAHRRMKVVARAATALHRLTKPTIAAVDGVAVGAGMNLALGCDMVIASDRARFSEIFVRRGLTVASENLALPRIVGSSAQGTGPVGPHRRDAEARRLGIVMRSFCRSVARPGNRYRSRFRRTDRADVRQAG